MSGGPWKAAGHPVGLAAVAIPEPTGLGGDDAASGTVRAAGSGGPVQDQDQDQDDGAQAHHVG